MWSYRTVIGSVVSFGGRTRLECGDDWWTWYRWVPEKYRTPLSITFGEVATHNHFVLDRGGKAFKQTAPVIKLPADATEDDHLALLGLLNSSTACFWMKQVCFPKATAVGDISSEAGRPENNRYAFNGTAIGNLPVPVEYSHSSMMSKTAAAIDSLATIKASLLPTAILSERARIDATRPLADRLRVPQHTTRKSIAR